MTAKKKKAGTEVVVYTPAEQQVLDQLAKEAEELGGGFSGPNSLTLNIKGKDKSGNKVPIGGWKVSTPEGDKYYDGEILFRPIEWVKLYKRFVEKDSGWDLEAWTKYFKDNRRDDMKDTQGTEGLNRIPGPKTDAEKKAERAKGEQYTDYFGIVTFPDTGEEFPVRYSTRGTKQFTIENAMKAVPGGMSKYLLFNFKINTFQPDDVTYWDITVVPDLAGGELPISPILEFKKDTAEFIKLHNDQVEEKYRVANGDALGEDLAANANIVDVTPDEDLADTLSDEIPF